jgi:DNA-binding NarL/FixJ family response regulator
MQSIHDASDEWTQQLLSPREFEVLQLVAEGLTDRLIGERLGISAKTVSEHVENVRSKLGASNRASAVYLFFVKLPAMADGLT